MNRNFILASLLLAIAVNFAIIGCHRKGDNETNVHPDSVMSQAITKSDSMIVAPDTSKNPYKDATVEIKIFSNESDLQGYGYDIYLNQKLYVHQPHVPAVAGSKGFSTPENAKKTGEFVAYKIRNNIMPPSVSPKELDSLGVLK
ncbi:MAG: DUF4907 domain-containing protein [Bacteroidetes bacterium]|nr:DUF4907 domain-containing protein [Bacteroidota bacterium]